VVLVGLLGGPRPSWVHDDDLPAALADPAQPATHVGRGEKAPVRHERVRSEHEQVVAAVEVRHRDAQQVAEHKAGRHLLRHLVDGARREDVPRPERAQQHGVVCQEGEVVGSRVPHVRRHGVPAVLLQDGGEPAVDLLERLVPGRLSQLAVATDQGCGQAVGILVELLQPVGLRAQEAAAEDVVAVAADRGHLLAVECHLEPAGGFAEGTGPVDEALGHNELGIIHTACM
jgi:hypothetical protein